MNVTSYLQQRQYGGLPKKKNSLSHVENYVEGKVANTFVNKACAMPGRCRSTFVMEFSPDGTKVASTHGDHSVRVSEIATGRCLKTLTGHPRTPWCLAYHPASTNILASGCLHGQVRIWDLYGNGCEVWQTENTTVIASLTFHPTDHVLVIAAANTIYFWDWSKPEPFAKCSTSHEFERIRWVKFDRLGSYLYTGISNNTSIHRENVTATSTHSEERLQGGSQGPPSRLGSVYNNIVDCFHEYQRDRLLQQYNPPQPPWHRTPATQQAHGIDSYDGLGSRVPEGERARSPLTVPETFPENTLDLNQSRDRQNELLLSSYSDLLAQRDRARAARDRLVSGTALAQRRQQRQDAARGLGLGTDCLINPRSDPFLPRVPEQGYLGDLQALGSNSGNRNNLGEAQGTRGIYSPPPAPSVDNLGETLIVAEENNLLGEIPNVHYGDSSIGYTSSDEVSDGHVQQGSESAVRGADGSTHVPELTGSLEASDCDISTNSNSHNRLADGANNSSGSGLIDSDVQRSSQSGIHRDSCSSTAATASMNSRLSIFSKRPTTSSQHFQSIRDRLQTSIPLSVDSGVGLPSGPVRVVSSTEASTDTIPQVTVISGSSTLTASTTTSVNSASGPVSISQVEQASGTLQRLISRLVQGQKSSQSGTASSTGSSSDCDSGANTNTQLQGHSYSTPSISSAPGTDSSLFNSMFPRHSNVHPGSYSRHYSGDSRLRTRPLSTRSHPYQWQNRPRGPYLPLLGPYLESRGVRAGEDGTAETSSTPRGPSDSISFVPRTVSCSSSSIASTLQPALTTARDNQTPSDTENEISSHLPQSGAYFMPISNNPLRGRSSASSCSTSSADRNSNPILSNGDTTDGTAGQSSRSSSQSQGQELELTVDQNDNYSASQVPNANIVNRSEIRYETQDDNNNSIHIVQPVPDVQPTIHIQASQRTSCNTQHVTAAEHSTAVALTQLSTSGALPAMSFAPPTSAPSRSFAPPSSVPTTVGHAPDQDYATLRNTFFNMTSQIEREMSDLNRRINALRESFNESLLALRQDRQRFENLGNLIEETTSSLPTTASAVMELPSSPSQVPPAITITRARDAEGRQVTAGTGIAGPEVPLSQPLTLLESSLRSHRWGRQQDTNIHDSASAADTAGSQQELLDRGDPHSWRYLHRHYLHPHYSSSILDETINRPNTAIQSAINRAIAGAFVGTGEAAVANNIINQTHRIQHWDFSRCDIPDISASNKNIVVPHCKLHNSASCDISQQGELLATFVPSHQGFPDDNILTVYSLQPQNRGQCLFTKSFGPNAISISISPCNNHVLVGLAAKRLSWVFTSDQLVAQIYRLEKEGAGEKSMKHVKDIMHTCSTGIRSHVSGNSARWLPLPGQGIVYGTNRGDLQLCRPGVKVIVEKTDRPEIQGRASDLGESSRNIRRCLLGRVPWLNYLSNPHRISTSTQTHGIRRSASTQTEQDEADNLVWL